MVLITCPGSDGTLWHFDIDSIFSSRIVYTFYASNLNYAWFLLANRGDVRKVYIWHYTNHYQNRCSRMNYHKAGQTCMRTENFNYFVLRSWILTSSNMTSAIIIASSRLCKITIISKCSPRTIFCGMCTRRNTSWITSTFSGVGTHIPEVGLRYTAWMFHDVMESGTSCESWYLLCRLWINKFGLLGLTRM